ncbi:MAG: ATP-binding cassette domain-containing protein [bacterium]|nr:ATP-binding cassette domain-containing protein [bacterium]
MKLEIRNLTKRFGAVVAVEYLSLQAMPGEVVAILGPNGSGKSTLLKLLACLLQPNEGELLFDDVKQTWSSQIVRQQTGYLPQTTIQKYRATGREVLSHYAKLLAVSAELPLTELARFFPIGALDRPIAGYSTGMQQQLSFAIATLTDAPILLLDEPTAALDPDAAAKVRARIVSERNRGKTILLCTHDLLDVETTADRIMLIAQGHIVGQTTRADLLGVEQTNNIERNRFAEKLEQLYRTSIHPFEEV